jgi:hypothetical protein
MDYLTRLINAEIDRKLALIYRDPNKAAVFDGTGPTPRYRNPTNNLDTQAHALIDHEGIPGVPAAEQFTEAIHDTHDHDGLPGVGNANIFRQVFKELTEWDIAHNLGDIPAVTLYTGDFYGFGTQAFGTTPFGGGVMNLVEDTKTPLIEVIDGNNLKATWSADKSGKAVCVG